MGENRRKFTLTELLVVMGIIAVLFGLLLPSVRKVRGPENRIRSQINLKQIGLAAHNYHDMHDGKFPNLCDFGEGAPTGTGRVSLFTELLPYLEGVSIYQMYDPKRPATYYDTQTGMARKIFRPYISPADPSAPDGAAGQATVEGSEKFTGEYATTSYSANGILFRPGAGPKTMRDGDGAAETIMFAERYQKCGPEGKEVYNLWALGAYSASTPAFALAPPEGDYPKALPALAQFVPDSPVPPSPAPSSHIHGRVGTQPIGFDAMANSAMAPGGFQVAPRGSIGCDPRLPQTPHTGGMIVSLGDASVRVVSSNISPSTFWAAVTPNGKEELGSDW